MRNQCQKNKVTEYIAGQKSRQEFSPLVGKLIDKARVEPLHLKNNAWAYFFEVILKAAVGKSNIPPSMQNLFSSTTGLLFYRNCQCT